ncbi:MAG: beta strand repeat-containing protein, partial [Rhodanobacteraceae bacterium]
MGLASTPAQAERNFGVRFDTNDFGDIQIIGNTLMSCPQGTNNPPTSCLASVPVSGTGATGGNLDDNNYNMRLVNTAGGTTSSSSADLALPAGATVLWAGLYWGADTSAGTNGTAAATPANRGQVRFSTPGGAYQAVTATQVDAATAAGQGTRFSAFLDVTTRVQAGGSGTYRVADIQAGTGSDRYAGWSLVVVVRDVAQPLRNLTVFDGYQVVNSAATTVNVTVSGFRTPLSGAFTVRAGAVAYEGDLGQTGDQLRVNGVNLGNAANPSANVFNSTISRLGANITAKNPNFVNQMGFDADVFDASGILANGATGATLTFTTGGETYYPAVLTFANDVYQPVVEGNVVKTVTDLNGGSVLPNDVLQYTVTVSNTGNDASANTVLTDAIPANTTYVAGSLQIASGANSGAKTDPSGDDQAEFTGTATRFRLGAGANATVGGTIGINQSTTITFNVRVNAGVPAGTTISNQASVAYNGASLGTPFTSLSDGDPNTSGTQPTTVVVGSAQARLSISKDGAPNPVVAGQNITYSLHVDNNGPNDASGLLVSDPLPAQVTFVSASASADWTISAPAVGTNGTVQFSAGALPVGSYDLFIVVRVIPGTPGGTVIGNTATISSSNDPTGSHAAATNTTVANSGDLALGKTASAVVGQGQQLTYQLQLNNPGPDPATGVVVSDPLPVGTTFVSAIAPPGWTTSTPAVGANGTVTFSIATLPAGAYTFTIVAQATAAAPIGGTLTNTATVTSTSADSNPANNIASAATTVQNPVPSVVKTFTPATVGSGIPSLLRITITNNAAVAISGVAISDTFPTTPGQMRITAPASGVSNTCGGTFTAANNQTSLALTGGSIAAGASCSITVNVVATTVGNYVNTTGNVTATQTPSGPTATATLAVGVLNAPTTTKSFTPASVVLGGTAQMTIAFANPNAAAITGVAFTDDYPTGIANSAGTIVASNSCGGTVTATASGNSFQLAGATIPVAGCSVVVNVVATAIGSSVNSTGPITSTNAQPGAGGTGTLNVTPLAAPTTTKSFTPSTVLLGGTAQMTITLTNPNATAIAQAGFSDAYPVGLINAAAGVVVSNTCGGTLTALPSDNSLDLSGGTIPASGSCSIIVNVVATAAGTLINSTGPISSSNAQSGAGGSGTLTVTPVANIAVVKTGPASAGFGSAIAYSIVVSNAGPSAADGTSFADAVPAGVTGIVASCGSPSAGAVCGAVNLAGNNVTSTITTLPSGGSVTFTISGVAPNSGASISNTATVATPAGTTDPANGNNTSTVTTTLLPPILSVSKTATPNPFIVGQPASYSITVLNTGAGSTTANITIADTLPTGITLASAVGTNWSCTGTTALACTFTGRLASGASTTLTLNVNVAANATIANNSATANGGGDATCPTAAHCIGTVVVGVSPSADIALAKTVDNATPNVGENVVFTVTVTNNGPSNASGVAVTDALPSGLVFVSAATSQGSYVSATGLWSVGTLANGASATLDITATVLMPGALTNIATRTGGNQFDPDPSNNSASASLNAQPTADLQVGKTVNNAVPNLGTNIVYTITLTNAGPNDATGVALSDPLPAGLAFVSAVASQGAYNPTTGAWTVGNVANAASATLQITATVTLPGDITNTASVSASNEFDPNTANNSGGVTINGQSADIQVVKTVDDANPIVGDTIAFTITVTNNGPSNATGIAVTDALPAELAFVSANASQGSYSAGTGVWTLGTLAPAGAGATATLTIVATVVADGGFTNTADVSAADQPDPNPANNTSSVAVTPVASADVSVQKTGPASVIAGQQVAYT